MSIENLRKEYIAVRRQIVAMKPTITASQLDEVVRASLPPNPGAFDWVAKINELHTLVLSAYNHPVEQEEFVDVDGYFGAAK